MARAPWPQGEHHQPTAPAVASPSSHITRAKAVTEAAREKLARTNQAFEKSRQLLHASEEIFHHTRARREYESEHGLAPPSPRPRKASLNILLIEDSRADATLFRHVLKECGLPYQLTVLSTGDEVKAFVTSATSAAACSLPRLIVADCMIPGMEGEDIVAAVRAVPAYQHVPVILFSSLPEAEGQRRCLQCDATAFVHKSGESWRPLLRQ